METKCMFISKDFPLIRQNSVEQKKTVGDYTAKK